MTLLWLKFAGLQAEVRWQVSHSAEVAMCVGVLPSALVPLWQLEQVPFASVWLNVLTGDQAVVVWQFSQTLLVERWVADFPVAEVPL